jgi:hypothetical protein
MVGIEIGVLAAQCLDRRIKSIQQLAAETAIWEQQRNAVAARDKWMFTTDKARAKTGHAYQGLRLTQVTLKESKSLCSGTTVTVTVPPPATTPPLMMTQDWCR